MTKTNFEPKDPRWTALALDEESLDAEGCAELEAILEESSEAREFVASLRATSHRVSDELRLDASDALTEDQRTNLVPKRSVLKIPAWAIAVAAVLVLTVGVFFLEQLRDEATPSEVARTGFPGTDGSSSIVEPSEMDVIGEDAVGKTRETSIEVVSHDDAPATLPDTPGVAPVAVPGLGLGGKAPDSAIGGPGRTGESEPRPGVEPKLRTDARPVLANDLDAVSSDVVARPVEQSVPPAFMEQITVTAETPTVDGTGLSIANSQDYFDLRASGSLTVHRPERSLVAPRSYEDLRATDSGYGAERYADITDNPFRHVLAKPLSTFSIDVDTASYANVRRFIERGSLPPVDAVRIEELVNYFSYDYPQPRGSEPFSVSMEAAPAPWEPQHQLVRVGLRGRDLAGERPPSNLVFLLDVSGSMDTPAKLPLLKQAMRLLINQLGENDRVAMVVYAGASGLALDSTTGDQKSAIFEALDRLDAGGSTNGGEGIQLAYDIAERQFRERGVNRVILATDGDFNVGLTGDAELRKLIETKAKTGVFLSVLGFGSGNLKDATLESLADRGNGNYSYIDSLSEARKVLVQEMGSTLVTIAKDVKIQVEFNPSLVDSYRLIGYENRLLAAKDFDDDTKDAGEIGAGHRVTALYELVPSGGDVKPGSSLKYQAPAVEPTDAASSDELFTIKLRYKRPDETQSRLIERVLRRGAAAEPSADLAFSSAVAAFGMILRDSPYKGNADWNLVVRLAEAGMGQDRHGYRAAFLDLARKAEAIRN